MNPPPALSWLNAPAWLPLIHALLHTLWQGALAAGGLSLVLRFVPAQRARRRYGWSAAALALVVLAGVGSWALLDAPRRPPTGTLRGDLPAAATVERLRAGLPSAGSVILPVSNGREPAARTAGSVSVVNNPDVSSAGRWVRWAAAGWLLGASTFLLRAARGTLGAGRLRRRCRDLADPGLLALAEQLRTRLGVSRRVRFLVCDEIGVPSMLGVIYPAVLLPATLLTGVPPEQLRAILAHELAHVRRWDYLANLAQTLAEAWLFFNPFVWWISRQIRLEREACCDQLAAEECQSPACYVEALVAVIERGRLAPVAPPPLLAASGPAARGGNTLERARRLLVPGYQPAFRIRWFSLAAVFLISGLVLGGWWLGTRAVAQTIQAAGGKTTPKPAAVAGLPGDALAAAREGNAKQALRSLEASLKPKELDGETTGHILDDLVRARELRAFTTLYDALRHSDAEDWKLGDEDLAVLVKDGRTDFLDALLARRFDLNRLTEAAKSAEPATAGWITRRVAEVTRQQADLAALCQAAADNDLPALQRWVDAGAEVNGVGQDNNTPLLRAVFKDRLEAAQFLLEHGAEVDKPRLPGWNYTPLCLVKSVPMAELLKKHGADVHAKLYERDESILAYVAEWAHADVVAWFLKQGLDANLPTDNQGNLLFGLDDGAKAEVLLEAGANPNQTDRFGQTPLSAALSAEVVQALVRHGANLKPGLKDGLTLLEHAVINVGPAKRDPQRDAACIEELIKEGAEFDPKGNGVKAMISAAFFDRVGEVGVFLDHGVSPDASDERGPADHRTALTEAALQGPRSLKLLLERGADPNAPVPAGTLTPLERALAYGAFGSVDVLRQAGAKGMSDLTYYSAKGDAARVGELLDQHADPNEATPSRWTPLRYAVRRAQVAVAARLLDHGASVDVFDAEGSSPYLDFAFYQQLIGWDARQAQQQWHLPAQEAKARLAAFQQLFGQHPPNPAYRDAAGRTALHQAAWSGSSFELGAMLAGFPPLFDPNFLDNEGQTPLLLAALSPAARETREDITSAPDTPQQKTWNQQAHIADELLRAGARLDLVVPGGKTVGELALAAAREAGNAQLAALLTVPAPAPTPGGSASAGSTDDHPPQDLANLEPDQHDTIWTAANAAIQAGDTGTIDGFLRRGLDVNVDLENSCSLLFVAVDDNQLAVVKLLLAHGANVLQKTSWGDVPLQRACWRGYKEVADTLIQAGAPKDEMWYATGLGDVPALEARDRRQPITPEEARGKLFFAVASGHPNTFEFLWKKLGPLDDTKKGKLLGDLYENAGKWGHANMLPVLEAVGASPAKDGPRALLLAAVWNFPDTVKALLERGVPPEPPSQPALLRDIAGEDHLEIVRLLLDHGANINVQDDHGFTPLSWAAYSGHEDMCLLLLDRGADARLKDHDGRNAAWHAAAGPHCPEALARMIKAGVPVDEKDKAGATILEHMTHFGTPSAWHGAFFMKTYSPADLVQFTESERRVVELLLAAGLDPNGPEGGPAPLTEAMHSQHYVMAQTLLDHGADATLRNKDGNIALYELISYAPDDAFPLKLFRTLVARSGDLNREITIPNVKPPMETTFLETLLNSAARHGSGADVRQEAVRIVLGAGEVFRGVPDAGVQGMLQAAARGNLERMQKSVQQGVPISATNEEGWDALSIATALDHNVCANWLIDHGADVNGHDHWSMSGPLNFAIQNGQADLVEKLLAKGAKTGGVYDGLYVAVEQKNTRIFTALLKAGADPKQQSLPTWSNGGKAYTPRHSVMLYLCIEKGLTDMALALLDKGADADPTHLEDDRNLAFWAVDYDRPEILRSLLDHGADPLAKDGKGTSALDLARKSHPKLVPMLEEAGQRRSAPAR